MSDERRWKDGAKAFAVRKVVEALGRSYRLQWQDGGERLRRLRASGEPAILSFWHNRIVCCSLYLRSELASQGYPLKVMISRSKDGELIARVVEAWGVTAARGSSSRGGSRALRELTRYLADGGGVVTTPDGPRGPVYAVQPGTVLLAQLSGVPIHPVSFAAEHAWRLHSWDRFIVPKPFSRIAVVVGEPLHIPRQIDDAERERLRRELEAVLRNTDQEAAAAVEWGRPRRRKRP